MLEKATIARPYAEAVFSQAQEEGKAGEWSDMLNLLNLVIADANMGAVINNPKLTVEQLYQFIIDICGDKLSQTGKNFVRVLIDAERIALAPEIYSMYEQKRSAAEGVVEVNVTSAFPLSEAQINTIAGAISNRLGKKVDVSVNEDKDLIGGVIIQAGDSVIDASVRGRLKKLNSVFAQ